ncbi:MAG: ribose 5-phosphate isomerase B [Planctomycetes bacterium]|nr:ribose 5-phosphate isomerase B [Planctomycetota bacterium]
MKIGLASDHGGFEYKERIAAFLKKAGHDVKDFGTFSNESCDYPKFIHPCAKAVAAGEVERGIILGGSGNGEAIVANRVRGIRAAVCWDNRSARYCRQHNDANIVSLGQRMMSIEQALEIVEIFLATPFDGGRHEKRIRQIDELS